MQWGKGCTGPARDFGWGWSELALFTAINSLPLPASHRKPPFGPTQPSRVLFFDPRPSHFRCLAYRPPSSVPSPAGVSSDGTSVALPNRVETALETMLVRSLTRRRSTSVDLGNRWFSPEDASSG